MDLTDTIIPKSDQLNSEDLIAGPRTFTITDVRGGSDEQPVNIHLAENPGRPFRPSKTVRRILVAAWGKDGDAYMGRRMTLYRDPAVKWAGQEIGGIRVSHLSHIDGPMKLALAVTKGKRENYTVQPLKDEPQPPSNAITPDKVTELGTAMTNALELTDRDAKIQWLTEQLDRPIKSPTELTRHEGDRLLELIRSLTEPPAEGDEPEQQEIGA
jgi:hypothetical protein